jgi:creatinine amidohydrolase
MLDVSNSYVEIERSAVDMAILPVGAIEQHGPHLPLSVDWVIGEAIAHRVAEKLDAFLMPGIAYGCSQAHKGFRGSVYISQATLGALLEDIAYSLIDQGFRRIVVINSHGGNLVLKLAVREINLSQDQCKVILLFPTNEIEPVRSKILEGGSSDAHAGELETSIMLHLAPNQVSSERVDHIPEGVSETYFDYTLLKELCPDGVWGRPSLATAEKGEKLMDAIVQRAVGNIETTFKNLGV